MYNKRMQFPHQSGVPYCADPSEDCFLFDCQKSKAVGCPKTFGFNPGRLLIFPRRREMTQGIDKNSGALVDMAPGSVVHRNKLHI
jgi:hypothetical protein